MQDQEFELYRTLNLNLINLTQKVKSDMIEANRLFILEKNKLDEENKEVEERIKAKQDEALLKINNYEMTVNHKNMQIYELIEKIKSKKKICNELKKNIHENNYQLDLINKETDQINKVNTELDHDIIKLASTNNELICNKTSLLDNIEYEKLFQNQLEKINSNYIGEIRFLHNELLENKGNIRVFCRVRPYLSKEEEFLEEIKKNKDNKYLLEGNYIEFIGNDKLIINGPLMKSQIGKQKETQAKDIYNFDKVFSPLSTQSEIFEEISQLVQSALDGYKVCIFAYGQTGSGKTYTMEGEENVEKKGIMPRSVEKIFQVQNELKKVGWKFQISISYFEIYLDQIHDLLSKNKDNTISQYNQKDITSINVCSYEETMPILMIALNKRTKAETNCNEKSSRSHSIFQLKIISKLDNTDINRNGTLNFIDLAGSERVNSSKVEGDKLKEAISINKSLSSLKGVISSLVNSSNNSKYVPYRESLLTYILQQYLGGDSKTLMFVNISPLITQINETNNSLKFATEVNSCQINKN